MDDQPIADEVGDWTATKLRILSGYALAYSKVFTGTKKGRLKHIYVDGFAGSGIDRMRSSGDFISGSPLQVLKIQPPFTEYHFVDLDNAKIEQLKELAPDRPEVHIYEGDCNEILLREVFPRIRYEDFRRGLCFLDPYGLHLSWEVIKKAGEMQSMEILINFPIMDMNREALWRDPTNVTAEQRERLDKFWGDESWVHAAYTTEADLFGLPEKTRNEDVVQAFRKRLKDVAKFKYVPEAVAMKNSTGSVLYYLLFASQNETGNRIMSYVFDKYRGEGARGGH